MQQESPFLIYKSSAGSGKTYTLAKEYLKLALRSPFYFKQILAVTFTNKAADEMKERVLTFLELLARKETSPLKKELSAHFSCTEEMLQENASGVLRNVLHDYSSFAITTIDTFFNQVIRTFTREIGLQGGFEIEMDLDNVLTEIIDKMLADLSESGDLKKWLIDFAKDRLQEGKSYEFREDIKTLARELFSEQYKALESSLSGLEVERETLQTLGEKLNKEIKTFRDKLAEIGREGFNVIENAGLSVSDFSNGKNGVANQFVKWGAGDLAEPGKRALEAMDDPSKWASKSSKLKEQLIGLAETKLLPLLADGIIYYQWNLQGYHTAVEVRKYLYTFGILNDLTIKIREYREEKEVILISDLPQFLRKIIKDSDAPYIYEKVGNRFQHFLIDEFQDTSAFQWGNFRPLVTNSIASGNFNMIVGDVKQSIYRWRGGDADLLLTKAAEEVGKSQTKEEFLSFNYRSFEEVISFNNEIFQVIPLLLRDYLNDQVSDLPEETKAKADTRISFLAQSYENAHQDMPEQVKSGGAVKVQFTAKPGRGEEENWDTLAVKWAIEQVETLQQNGAALQDIAILVRDGGQEGKLVKALGLHAQSEDALPNCSYQVISVQAMFLTNASVVNFMIAIFKYLNNQKEQIAITEIIHEYQRHILDQDEDLHDLFTKGMKQFLPEAFTKYIHTLGRFPLYELTEILIRVFKLEKKKGEVAYLQAFQDAILDYTKNEKGDLSSFLKWWELKGRKRTVRFSDNLEAIKISTIHKSKGLQYKHVLVPFCNWNMDHNTLFSNILWAEKPEEKPFSSLPAIPLRYSGGLQNTLFASHYFDEKIKAFHDNLNLLYVALTRAEKTLLIHAQKPSKSRKNKEMGSISDLLWDHVESLWEFDKESSSYKVGSIKHEEEKKKEHPAEEIYLQSYVSNKWSHKLSIRKQSGDYFDFGNSETELKVNIGVLTHQLLSEIKYLDELKESVKAAYLNMQITKNDSITLLKSIQKLFKNEQIANWYSRDYEVRNEVVVLPQDGQIKRLDRVVIKDGKAIIIDFKTGKPAKTHKKQVLSYMSLLSEMNYEEVSGYLVYLNGSESEEEISEPQIIQVG